MTLRRIVTVLAVGALLLVLMAGAAYAVTKVCDTTCKGTNKRDTLTGTAADTTFYGKRGSDRITDIAGPDNDVVYAGRGKDTVNVMDNVQGNNKDNGDYVDCGSGYDTVFFNESRDTVVNCENQNPR